MADTWAITMSALALLGTLPNYIKNWEDLFKKGIDENLPNKKDFDEFRKIFLFAQKDFLFHKIISLNTVIMLSAEHAVNRGLLDYCKEEIVRTKESLETIRNTLKDDGFLERQ